jgi:hypothetical protein
MADSSVLPKPWQQKAISYDWVPGQTIPKIDHGSIVIHRRIVVDEMQNDALYLKSLADGTEHRLPFWLNGASVIWINDLAIASVDRVFIVGSFSRASNEPIVNFMAESDMTGHVVRTVDMGSYEPELSCVSSDGSLWTFGQDWSAERSDISYSLLRNYSSTGRLLASYLPSDSLPPAKLNYSTRLHRLGGTPGRIFLQCGEQSVGAYIGPLRTWAEIDLGDRTSHTWLMTLPSAGRITGLALLGEHQVYCSFRGWKAVFVRGVFKLTLDEPKVAAWEPVSGMVEYLNISGKSRPARFVYGADGPNLVYVDVDSNKLMFSWVRP